MGPAEHAGADAERHEACSFTGIHIRALVARRSRCLTSHTLDGTKRIVTRGMVDATWTNDAGDVEFAHGGAAGRDVAGGDFLLS